MDNTQILVDALENIASYSTKDGGHRPYGLDIPDLAIKALVDYRNAEWKDKQEEAQPEGE